MAETSMTDIDVCKAVGRVAEYAERVAEDASRWMFRLSALSSAVIWAARPAATDADRAAALRLAEQAEAQVEDAWECSGQAEHDRRVREEHDQRMAALDAAGDGAL